MKVLTGVKGAFAGKFNARVGSPTPCIATVPLGAYEAGGLGTGSAPPTEAFQTTSAIERVRHVETRSKPKNTVDLKSATVIVSAGRGFKRKEDLVLVEELAEAVGGRGRSFEAALFRPGLAGRGAPHRSDRDIRPPEPVHRRGHLWAATARRRHQGLQGHRGDKQGQAGANLPGS